jgi:hypothetical protein
LQIVADDQRRPSNVPLSTVSPATRSEKWFEQYLSQAGCGYEYERDLAVRTRPDYLIRCGDDEAICEVEELAEPPAVMRQRERVFMLGPKDEYGPVRRKIRAAARQLKPLSGDGRALIVVVADPCSYGHGLEAEDMIYAMYGNPAVSVPIDVVDPEGAKLFAGRDGRLTTDHPYVSGVGSLRVDSQSAAWFQDQVFQLRQGSRFAKEFLERARRISAADAPNSRFRIVFVESLTAIRGEAARLPVGIFAATGDERWTPGADGRFSRTR